MADFCADRSGLIPPLPWQTSSPPFSGDRDEAIVLKMSENFFRNDLSMIDRAVFVQTCRDVWERKYGEINPKGRSPLQ